MPRWLHVLLAQDIAQAIVHLIEELDFIPRERPLYNILYECFQGLLRLLGVCRRSSVVDLVDKSIKVRYGAFVLITDSDGFVIERVFHLTHVLELLNK